MPNPFPAVFVPGRFHCSETHLNALAGILYAVSHRLPAVLLEGAPGTGKTAVLQELIWRTGRHNAPVRPLLACERPHGAAGLRKWLASCLGVAPDWASLQEPLRRLAAQQVTPVLLLDEADGLDDGAWDLVRGITQWSQAGRALLPVVLAGPPGLEARLPQSICQSLDVRLELAPLTTRESLEYIESLWAFDAEGPLRLSPEVRRTIASASGGIPRVINRLCRQALRPEAPPVRRRTRKVLAMGQGSGLPYVAEGGVK